MANVDRPNGLKLVGHISGSPFNAQIKMCSFAAGDGTATFVGDAVKLAGDADTFGRPTVAQASDTGAIYGVVLDFEYDPTDLGKVHRAASTARLAYVCVDPNAIFEIQDDASATMTSADIGSNADLVIGSGNTTTGNSAMELQSSSINTTATLQLKILNLVNRDDNAFGNQNRVHVKINNHQLAAHTGTAGV